MRIPACVLACLLLAGAASRAAAGGLEGAVSLLVFRPLSSDLNEKYTLGAGAALDLGLVYSSHFRLSLQSSPRLAWGTPPSGSLAEQPEADLFMLPAHAVLQYLHPSGDLCPYAGLGAGVLYAHESISFDSRLGTREQSYSATRFSWTLMAGIEKGKRSRVFTELQFQNASTAGVEGQSDSGASLASLELRLGWRGTLK